MMMPDKRPYGKRIIRQTDEPEVRIRERNQARSALAKALYLSYEEDMPDRLADKLRQIVYEGTRNAS
jgi:hypothetical protein